MSISRLDRLMADRQMFVELAAAGSATAQEQVDGYDSIISEMTSGLRERICMALIASPTPAYEIVERATAIEAYINGTAKP